MRFKIFLFFIFLKLFIDTLKKGKILHEGFQCNYRKRKKGKMCNEKWGEPKCGDWKKIQKIKGFEESPKTNVLKGHYTNPYMYEIDYEGEEEGGEEGKDGEEGNLTFPKGIHSSFFS